MPLLPRPLPRASLSSCSRAGREGREQTLMGGSHSVSIKLGAILWMSSVFERHFQFLFLLEDFALAHMYSLEGERQRQ